MEIEKKFLVKDVPDISEFDFSEITQGYLSYSPEIRIRNKGGKYFLTQKGDGSLEREEVEPEINAPIYQVLSNLVLGNLINKTRYRIPLENGLTAELDIYHGKLKGLVTVEVELDTREQAESFTQPEWFHTDVTYDSRYKNKNLSKIEDVTPLIQE